MPVAFTTVPATHAVSCDAPMPHARPSPHGNIRASRAAASHAAPTACSRPGPPTTRSGGLRGRRTPSGRRATTHSTPQPTAQPCQPSLRLKRKLHKQAHNRAQRTAHAGARAAHADSRAIPTRTRAQHARIARQRSAAHRAHLPTSAAASLPQSSSHTRARTHTPHAGARIGRRREEPKDTGADSPRHRAVSLQAPPGIKLAPSRHQAGSLQASRCSLQAFG